MAELETLEIVIEHKSSTAADSVRDLSLALKGLKSALNATGIERLTAGFIGLDNAIKRLSTSSLSRLERLAESFNKMRGVDIKEVMRGLNAGSTIKQAADAVKAYKDPIEMSDAEFDKLYNNYTPYLDYTKAEIEEAERLERHMESLSSASQIKPYQAVSTEGYAFAKASSELDALGNKADTAREKLISVLNAIKNGGSAVDGWFDGISGDALKSRIKEVYRELTNAQKELLGVRSGGLLGTDEMSLEKATSNVDMLTMQLHALQAALMNIDPSAKEAKLGLEEVGDAGEKSKSKLAGLVSQFWRLAKLRMMRAVLRSIAEGLRTGIDNLYQWSKATNGAFASSMDAASSSMLTMKNSIATAVAPALMSLVPVLQTVVGWVVTAMNAIAQLLAMLRGASSWTRAKTAVTEYGAAAKKSLGGAGSAAKNVLADFDELNVLNRGGGGGGGGGGAGGLDYTDMFEEVTEFSPFLEKLRPILEWVGSHLGTIAKIIGGIVLTVKGVKWFAGLTRISNILGGGGGGGAGGAGGGKGIAGAMRKIIGLYAAVIGYTHMIPSFIDQWKNGINDINSKEYLLGTVESVGGLALAFGKAGAGIGLMVAGVGQVAAGIKDIIDNGPSLENVGYTISGLGEGILGFGLKTGNIPMMVAGGVTMAIGYIVKYWEDIKRVLIAAWEWFDSEIIQPIGEKLGLFAEEVNEFFVENNILGKGTRRWMEETGGDKALYIPYRLGLVPDGGFKHNDPNALLEGWNEQFFGNGYGRNLLANPYTQDPERIPGALSGVMGEVLGNLNHQTPSFGEMFETITTKPNTLRRVQSAGKTVGESVGDGVETTLEKTVPGALAGVVDNAWDTLKNKDSNKFGQLFDTESKTVGKRFAQNMTEQLRTVRFGANLSATLHLNPDLTDVEKALRAIDLQKVTKNDGTSNWKIIPKLASGGIPDHGDLFIANEAGAELVGRIGNRTGVANQQQIADVISQQMNREGGSNSNGADVAAAVASALKNVVMYVDGQAFGHLAVKKINEYQSATGRVELRI